MRVPITAPPANGRTQRPGSISKPVALALATSAERERIYQFRHEVYAQELGQHRLNSEGRLSDALDPHNLYLVARVGGELAGFVSLTPPGAPSLSIDKYVHRERLPFTVDEGLYEVRLLTVLKPHRGRELATLLMYAAFRWIESHGGTHIAAIGRREVLDLYLKTGLRPVGISVQSGAVTYDFLHATVAELRARLDDFTCLLERLEGRTQWQLNFPFCKPAGCFHGGAFFAAIGERFEALERSHEIINPDVLDAWFPPAPGVLGALQTHLPWLLRTSPPTSCSGLVAAIAEARGVRPHNLLPGAGSSDLIFRALRQWLTPRSRALILDPTYGEYAHVLERVIGCRVDRLTLARANGYQVNLAQLEAALAKEYDLVVLVNPNSPTGRHVAREELETVLRRAPTSTRIWVDETYVEYATTCSGPTPQSEACSSRREEALTSFAQRRVSLLTSGATDQGEGWDRRSALLSPTGLPTSQSLEHFAAASENVIVCKSMSMVYALSGARVAYLCAGPHQLEELQAITPPWVVSLPGQLAAVRALADPDYYAERYRQTQEFRAQLGERLAAFGWEVLPGIANFLLCHLPGDGPTAEAIVRACRERGLFLRNAALMGAELGPRAIRLAVKDAATNERMIVILGDVLSVLTPRNGNSHALVS